jgi:hypothetical protein
MAWILLLLAVACFLVPYFTTSFALGALCLALSLVLVIVALVMLLAARIGDASRDLDILSTEELRALREQAQAARQRAADPAAHVDDASSGHANTTPPSPPM